MIILYCETCGKRIAQDQLDTLGIKEALPDNKYFCIQCQPAAATPSSARASMRGMRPATADRIIPPSGSNLKKQQQPGTPRHGTPAVVVPSGNMKWVAAIGAGVVVGLVLIFATGSRETSASRKETVARVEPEVSRKGVTTPPPEVKAAPVRDQQPVANVVRTPAPVPAPTPPPVAQQNPQTPQLSPKEEYELRVKQGLIKKEEPAAAPADVAGLTDVDSLRKHLLKIGRGAPRDLVKKLGEMPPPDMAETVAFDAHPGSGGTGVWSGDYNSKVSAVTVDGEKGVKAEKGSDRVAMYFNAPIAANRSRLVMRVHQTGLSEIRISINCSLGVRFRMDIKAPPEGQWSDVTADLNKLRGDDGIQFENQPVQHIEIHGLRKAANNGASFVLSKCQVVSGK